MSLAVTKMGNQLVPVFDSNRVSLSDIQSDGHVSGRDVNDNRIFNNITNNNYQEPIVYREDKRLRALIEEHEREIRINPEYKQFSDKLNNFLNRKVEGNLRDLSQKLIDGDRVHLVEFAMEAKESITKKITKNCHFESAQKIYTYLLAEIRIAFLSEITSRIKSGDFNHYQIDDRILDRIIEPLLINVEGCSLQIDKEELFGLLYVLTGNCYIAWD